MCSYKLFCCCIFAIIALNDANRILDAKPVDITKHPHQVSIRLNDDKGARHICAGSIIRELFVVTAASCLHEHIKCALIEVPDGKPDESFSTTENYDQGSWLSVVAGTSFLDKGGDIHKVKRCYIKSTYDHNSVPKPDNIALVKVEEKFKFSDKIQSRGLDFLITGSIQRGLLKFNFSGWGIIQENGTSPSNQLQEIELELLPYDKCQEAYSKLNISLPKSINCATTVPKVGVCDGDHGGAMILSGFKEKLVCGILGYTGKCGDPAYPAVFASVNRYRNWLDYTLFAATYKPDLQ